ncbi:MAG: hypothetical protein IPM92_04530 [Saprospiraceae bacterium]|nr:hypothetical protein [Saprospiraceae bacterium]
MYKILGVLILSIHGLIHLMGFMKAFHWGQVSQIAKEISKPWGLVWLLTAMILVGAAITFALNYRLWWALAGIGLVLSLILIFTTWQDAKFGMIPNALLFGMLMIAYASCSFYNIFLKDVDLFLQSDVANTSEILTESDIVELPEPVQKYLRYTASIGKPHVHYFEAEFSGKIRKNDQYEWMPLHTQQYNFMANPARLFFMNAVMKTLPVAGIHSYKNGKATMDIRLFSLLQVQFMDGRDMDVAETVTFFNDMCVLAPPTLIDQRIKWVEVNGNQVKASFTNKEIVVTACLYFNDEGQLINFSSDDRYNFDAAKKLKWSTPLRNYKEFNGYRLATSADAIYHYPKGDVIYGSFDLQKLMYNVKKID